MIRGTVARLTIILWLLVLNSCYSTTTFDETVVIRHGERYLYEIRLHSRTEGRGNIHDPFDLSKHKYESDYSICVNSLEGKIDAKDMIFTQVEGCKPNASFWIDQAGFIEFRDDCLTVALEAAYIKERRREPLPANGTYKITQLLDKRLEPGTVCKR